MTDSTRKPHADQQAADREAAERLDARWIDQHQGASSSNEAAHDAAHDAEVTPDPLRVADHQLLDALLEQSRPSRQRETAAAVTTVMGRLRAESTGRESATPAPSVSLHQGERPLRGAWRAARWVAASLAASALVASLAFVGWNFFETGSAYALAERIEDVARQPIDREYRVEIAPSIPLAQRRVAKLWVRGGDRFVFDDPGPLGVRLLFGRDEKGMWQVPPVGPPRRGEVAAMLPVSKGADEVVLPYLQLAAVMDRVRSRYSIASERGESLVDGGPVCKKLSATILPEYRESDFIAPETITIWSNRRTAVIERLQLRWPSSGLRATPKEMVFQLAQQSPVDDRVYQLGNYAMDVE